MDGFFGATDVESEENVSRGRLNVGYYWDERDGQQAARPFQGPYPNACSKGARDVSYSGVAMSTVSWTARKVTMSIHYLTDSMILKTMSGCLVSATAGRVELQRAGTFGLGVELATPLEPYVRATYRWNKSLNDDWFLRVHPRVFWQNQRGFGATLTNILDHAFSRNWLFRSWTILQGEDEIEGLGWTQRFFRLPGAGERGRAFLQRIRDRRNGQ